MQRILASLIVLSSIALWTPLSASAQDSIQPHYMEVDPPTIADLPTNYVERPLTLPGGTVQGDFLLQVLRIDVDGLEDTGVLVNLGGAVGITDDLHVGIGAERIAGRRSHSGLVPLLLVPDVEYGDILVYGCYRLLASDVFELAAELSFQIPTSTDFGFVVGAPLRARFGELFAIDATVEVGTLFADNTVATLNTVLQPRLAPVPTIYLGINTGLLVELTNENDILIPLGLEAGFVLDLGTTKVDLFAEFNFPIFYQNIDLGAGRASDVFTEVWVLGVGARAYMNVFGR